MSNRNRPGRDARQNLRDGLDLADAIKRGDAERAKKLADEIQRRERERIARVSLARAAGKK